MALDQEKLNHFLQKALNDLGATFHANLIIIGDKLGLYKAMAGAVPKSKPSPWRMRIVRPSCPERSNWPRRRSKPNRSCLRHFIRVLVWAGMSMTQNYFRVPSGSSGLATPRT
jgi:hypothetical protein